VSSAGVLTQPRRTPGHHPHSSRCSRVTAAARPGGAAGIAGRWAWALCAPLGAYVVVTTAPHGQWTEFTLYLAALCLPIVLIVSAGGHLALTDLRSGLTLALAIMVIGSLVVGVVRPDLGIEGTRLRGC
jgi:hypothetical protein